MKTFLGCRKKNWETVQFHGMGVILMLKLAKVQNHWTNSRIYTIIVYDLMQKLMDY